MKKKWLSKLGFTLAETLLALGLMSVVMTATTAGIIAARRNYKRIITKTDALTLLSTISLSMEADLASASDVQFIEIADDYRPNSTGEIIEAVRFNSLQRSYSMFYDNIDGQICIIAYDYGDVYMVIPVTSSAAHTSLLKSELASIQYFPEHHYFEYIINIRDKETNEIIISQKFDTRTYN